MSMQDEYTKARDAKVLELVKRANGDPRYWPERTVSDAADWGRAWGALNDCRMIDCILSRDVLSGNTAEFDWNEIVLIAKRLKADATSGEAGK